MTWSREKSKKHTENFNKLPHVCDDIDDVIIMSHTGTESPAPKRRRYKRRRLYFWELFWEWRSFQIQVRFAVWFIYNDVDEKQTCHHHDNVIILYLFQYDFSSNKWSLHGQIFNYYGQTSVAKGLQVMHIGTFDGTSTRAQYWELQYDDTFTISESETVFDNWYVPYIWFYWIKNKYFLYFIYFFIWPWDLAPDKFCVLVFRTKIIGKCIL